MKKVVYYNPLTAIMDVFRVVVVEGQIPRIERVIYSILISVGMFLVGRTVFKKRQNSFILDL